MGSGGFILGGLLGGIGKGMEINIAQRREMALQQLRGQQAAAADERQAAREADRDERKFRNDAGLLKIGSTLKIAEGDAGSANNIAEKGAQGKIDVIVEGAKAANAIKLENVRASNARALEGIQHKYRLNEAAVDFARKADDEAKKAGQQIDRWDTDENGNMVGFTKTGTIYRSNVKLKDKSAAEDDPIGRRAGGEPAATPTPAATPSPAARPAARPPAQTRQKPASGRPVLTGDEMQSAINDAVKLRANGAPGWKGISDAQMRQKLADIYGARGYDLPPLR